MQGKHEGELVKRFVAPTMRRALQMVSEELGAEALILSSQKTQRGIEVVVSLEPDFVTRGVDIRREFGQNFDSDLDSPMQSDSAWRVQAGVEKAAAKYPGTVELNGSPKSPRNLAQEIEQAREKMLAAKRAAKENAEAEISQKLTASSVAAPPVRKGEFSFTEEENLDALKTEIADMRLLLEQQLWQMSEQVGQLSIPHVKPLTRSSMLGTHLKRLGLTESLAQELLQGVKEDEGPSISWRNCMATLSRRIPVVGGDMVAQGGRFSFVGPTGVGKTTTIGKLAAQYTLQHGIGKVAIVTTDAYRVGAHDQLRSLGRILSVPVRVVDKEHDILSILAHFKHFPLVLIDTAGFRQGDPLLKEQLDRLNTCPFVKRILVMACNSQFQTMKASVHAYSSGRKIAACVLTKLDESNSLGEAMSILLQSEIPLAYTTDGQAIPADIGTTSGPGLVARAVSMMKNNRNDQNVAGIQGQY